jgi:hypothetical protein
LIFEFVVIELNQRPKTSSERIHIYAQPSDAQARNFVSQRKLRSREKNWPLPNSNLADRYFNDMSRMPSKAELYTQIFHLKNCSNLRGCFLTLIASADSRMTALQPEHEYLG